MQEQLLVVFILMSAGLLVAVVVQWVYAIALAHRLAATQGRLLTLERHNARRLDALSGRLGLVERGGAVAEPTEPAPEPEPAPTARPAAEPEPEIAPEPNASLAAFRRAKDNLRGADSPVGPQVKPEEKDKATRADASCSDEGEQATRADAAALDEAAGDGDEAGLRPVADRDVCPTEEAKTVRPTQEDGNVGTAQAEDSGYQAPPAGWHVQPAAEEPAAARSAALDFEQLLGGKVFVWIGAVALVLTGAFLLKYGFDHDIITEPMRVIAAGVFGVALIGVAEWLRPRGEGRYVQIAQAACGAGVAVLFGTVYAGHSLYHLIWDVPAFMLMAAVTAGAVLLSLRFGPLVALLGLVGGFALPPLLGEALPGQPAMVVYLLALELGVLALTRKRGWLGISALTLLGSVAWALGYIAFGGEADLERGATALLLMGTAVIFVVNTALVHGRPDAEAFGSADGTLAQKFWLAIGAAGSAVALLAVLVVRSGYDGQDVVMLGLMSAGTLVLARLDARYTLLSWVAFGLGAVVLLGAGLAEWWGMGPADLTVLWRGTVAFGLLFGLGGYAAQWWPTRRKAFALLSALSGPVFLTAAYVGGGWVTGYYDGRAGWWPWALALSVGYGVMAWPLVRGWLRVGTVREPAAEAASASASAEAEAGRWCASAYALSCVGLAGLAVVFGLNHPWLAVGWALLGAAAGVAGWKLRLSVLTYASAALAAGSAVLLIVPGPFMIDIGGVVLYNTLLVVYGLAALGFGVTAYAAHRAGFASVSRPIQGLAVGALAVGCASLVRHGFHPEVFLAESVRLYEWPTYAVVLMSLGLGVVVAARRLGLGTVGFVGTSVGMIGVVLAVVGPVLFGNPLGYQGGEHAAAAGGVSLMFGMLYLYAVPAALVCLLARAYDRIDEDAVARALRTVAVALAAVFVVMQVRNSFNLADLHRMRVGFYERGTYGLALIALAFALWSYARVAGSFFARQAGRVVATVGMGASLMLMLIVGSPLTDPWLAGGGWLVVALCYAYLLPAAAGWGFAHVLAAQDKPGHERFLRLGGVLLTTAFVGLQVRNGFHMARLHTPDITLFEWATYGLCWIGLGGAFAITGWRVRTRDIRRLLVGSGLVVGLLGIAAALLGTWLVDNPLWTRNAVGTTPIVNGLWYLYGPTILALAVLARLLRRFGQTPWARAAGGASIALGFGLLSLLVRQGFSDAGVLHLALSTRDAEWYAYSLAWVVYGIGLLIAGIATKLETLRYGSLAVMLLAVAKVFALDTAGLQDLLRVFSFLGLGVTLLLLGYTYQRFVFRRPIVGNTEPEAMS